MLFLDLQEDVMLLTCSFLSVDDILLLRQVCTTMNHLTRLKAVWLTQLTWLLRQGTRIPVYIGDHLVLKSPDLESLVRRLSYASRKWAPAETPSPFRIWPINLPQSITWLHVTQGRWLFVASSDENVSKLGCWDIFRIFEGNVEPIAQGYLPDVVKTGKTEVQGRDIVLGLGLGSQSNSTHIIALRKLHQDYSLVEIARIPNSTHVLLLSGTFIGCAIHRGSNVPHLIDWKKSLIVEIPPPPGGLEVHGRRSVPNVMTLWNNNKLVIIRSVALEVYDVSLTAQASVVYCGSITLPRIWEVQVLPVYLAGSPLRLVILSQVGLELIALDPVLLHDLHDDRDEVYPSTCIAQYPSDYQFPCPWYQLGVSPDGTRATWLDTARPEEKYSHPRFLSVPLPSAGEQLLQNIPPQSWDIDLNSDPAIWARPQIEADETLGITIVGNCFGELGVYDFGRGVGFPSCVFDQEADGDVEMIPGHALAQTLIKLAPRRGPREPMSEDEFREATAHWSQDRIIDWLWINDWYEDRDWAQVYRWIGHSGDFAWSIEHEYGFPGEALPQAYTPREHSADTPCTLFRIGNRYLVEDEDGFIRSWPNNVDHGFVVHAADIEEPIRPTTETEDSVFWKSFRLDWQSHKPRRNRWAEQQERGGFTDWSLSWEEEELALAKDDPLSSMHDFGMRVEHGG
ncbi:F-box domain-containing protein [Mycena indigotica]|uniref:F-box domain-containing protein n=1 Tax=Mycena indigotica TaxID=2126181 RepID=A0A8H6SX37_9AGAR|nr:F-box domain-containing protein [Mycena indigotica]KAF7307573.1 F-box domain-containing protein [Mycena indigotica]